MGNDAGPALLIRGPCDAAGGPTAVSALQGQPYHAPFCVSRKLSAKGARRVRGADRRQRHPLSPSLLASLSLPQSLLRRVDMLAVAPAPDGQPEAPTPTCKVAPPAAAARVRRRSSGTRAVPDMAVPGSPTTREGSLYTAPRSRLHSSAARSEGAVVSAHAAVAMVSACRTRTSRAPSTRTPARLRPEPICPDAAVAGDCWRRLCDAGGAGGPRPAVCVGGARGRCASLASRRCRPRAPRRRSATSSASGKRPVPAALPAFVSRPSSRPLGDALVPPVPLSPPALLDRHAPLCATFLLAPLPHHVYRSRPSLRPRPSQWSLPSHGHVPLWSRPSVITSLYTVTSLSFVTSLSLVTSLCGHVPL